MKAVLKLHLQNTPNFSYKIPLNSRENQLPKSPFYTHSGRGVVVRKAGLKGERKAKAEKMCGLMDGFLKNDAVSLQKDILDYVEFTVARSRFNFDDFEAYQECVRRVLIVAAQDKVLKKECAMIEKNPPDEVEEISGADHMAMMS